MTCVHLYLVGDVEAVASATEVGMAGVGFSSSGTEFLELGVIVVLIFVLDIAID